MYNSSKRSTDRRLPQKLSVNKINRQRLEAKWRFFLCLHLKEVYVLQNGEYKLLEIERIRFTPKCGIIKFKGIDSLNDILAYKNQLLFVDEGTVREFLDEDEFLIDELVGLDVYDGEKKVGAVVGVSNNGASDLLSIKTLSKKVSLIPFVKAIVLSVDIKARKIQINNIEGLLE